MSGSTDLTEGFLHKYQDALTISIQLKGIINVISVLNVNIYLIVEINSSLFLNCVFKMYEIPAIGLAFKDLQENLRSVMTRFDRNCD